MILVKFKFIFYLNKLQYEPYVINLEPNDQTVERL